MTGTDVVRTRALQITALVALVGSRVYVQKLPQSPTLPAVRVQQISRVNTTHLRGVDGMCRARVQVDAIAKESSGTDPMASARAVSEAAHGAFSGGVATGLAGWEGTLSGVKVHKIAPIAQRELYAADELRECMVSTDYDVVWEGLES